jgi:hypothetical protein
MQGKADARSKDGKLRESRPGRCARQGLVDVLGKAGQLR